MNETMYTRNPLMTGFTEHWFTTKDNCRIHYVRKGEGMPLIFLHGWGDDLDAWMLNAPEFTDDYCVYVLDQRGFGFSDAPDHGARISRLGADLNEFIESLGVPKVNIVAWSMGCSVVWSYIDLFGQDRINKVVFDDEPPFLVSNPKDGTAEILKYSGNRMDPWYLPNILKDYGYVWTPENPFFKAFSACFERGVFAFTEEEYASMPDNFAEKMAQRPPMAPANVEFIANLLRDHLLIDWRDIFHTIKVPVLFLTGDLSHAVTPECAKWLEETIPDCTIVNFTAEEYGNHDLNQTAYKKFNREVMAFFKK